MVGEGFLRPEHRATLIADAEPARLLERLERWTPAAVHKWVDLERS
jgi:hypothetical protein